MVNLLTVIGVGFLLGIRHATDPDHVIAVTTIVSRQRSIRHAGLIGILWGRGHTITILFVGAANHSVQPGYSFPRWPDDGTGREPDAHIPGGAESDGRYAVGH